MRRGPRAFVGVTSAIDAPRDCKNARRGAKISSRDPPDEPAPSSRRLASHAAAPSVHEKKPMPSGGKHGRKTHLGLGLGDGLLGGLGLAIEGVHAGGAHGTDGLDGGDHGGADEGGHGEHLRVLRLRVSEWEGGRGRNRRWVWVSPWFIEPHIALRGNLSRSYWSRTRLIYWPQSPWGINSRK